MPNVLCITRSALRPAHIVELERIAGPDARIVVVNPGATETLNRELDATWDAIWSRGATPDQRQAVAAHRCVKLVAVQRRLHEGRNRRPGRFNDTFDHLSVMDADGSSSNISDSGLVSLSQH